MCISYFAYRFLCLLCCLEAFPRRLQMLKTAGWKKVWIRPFFSELNGKGPKTFMCFIYRVSSNSLGMSAMTSPETFIFFFFYISHFTPLYYITTQIQAIQQAEYQAAFQPPETVRKIQPSYLGSWMSQELGI